MDNLFEFKENHIKKILIGLEGIYQNQSKYFSIQFLSINAVSKLLNQVMEKISKMILLMNIQKS